MASNRTRVLGVVKSMSKIIHSRIYHFDGTVWPLEEGRDKTQVYCMETPISWALTTVHCCDSGFLSSSACMWPVLMVCSCPVKCARVIWYDNAACSSGARQFWIMHLYLRYCFFCYIKCLYGVCTRQKVRACSDCYLPKLVFWFLEKYSVMI